MKNTHQLRFAMLLAQFSFTSVALAAGKLTPAPEAANEYVRVWSDTVGVHEVQNPDGGLDFWITTTNVVDGFTAEVVVEEIDEDSWRLKEPQSGKRNPMHPGDKLKYVVEDVSGVEQDKTGWIKLYRVDVMIDDVGEANEEADGARCLQNRPGRIQRSRHRQVSCSRRLAVLHSRRGRRCDNRNQELHLVGSKR